MPGGSSRGGQGVMGMGNLPPQRIEQIVYAAQLTHNCQFRQGRSFQLRLCDDHLGYEVSVPWRNFPS
jgi:hypothetical protein